MKNEYEIMSNEKIDKELSDAQSEKSAQKGNESPKPRRAFSNIGRELSDEELKSPAVQKLLLDSLDQLENINFKLEIFEEKFHIVDKEKAILEEKLINIKSSEILYSFTLTIGAALIGMSNSSESRSYFWIFISSGVLLILGGLLSKFVRK